jgi:hypothetical protein
MTSHGGACRDGGAGPYASVVLLGDDLLPLLLLAFGAAMAVGSGMALVRPPAVRDGDGDGEGDELARPPLARSVTFIVVGLVVATWAIASLLAG